MYTYTPVDVKSYEKPYLQIGQKGGTGGGAVHNLPVDTTAWLSGAYVDTTQMTVLGK